MITRRRSFRPYRVLGSVLLAVGMSPFGGCGSMPGAFDSDQSPLSASGPREGTAAFEEQVQRDRFPSAGQALAEGSLMVTGG